jgi:hypothetical protein
MAITVERLAELTTAASLQTGIEDLTLTGEEYPVYLDLLAIERDKREKDMLAGTVDPLPE